MASYTSVRAWPNARVTRAVAALALLMVATAFVSASATKCPNVPVAQNFVLEKYAGVWYEIADSKNFKSMFEKDLYCTTANYTLESGYVQVNNGGRYGSPTGPRKQAVGMAKQVEGAKLEVKFPGSPVYGPYWIVELLGEAETGFEVSLVYSCSSILGIFRIEDMWLLSRTPELPAGITAESVYAKATALGIDVTSLNMTPTFQSTTKCIYHDY